MKKIIISVAIILFLCIAFIKGEINPFEWEITDRAAFICSIPALSVLTFLFNGIKE